MPAFEMNKIVGRRNANKARAKIISGQHYGVSHSIGVARDEFMA